MVNVLSAGDMKSVDKYSIEKIGIPSLVLMERAAYEVYNVAKSIISESGLSNPKVLVVCGIGNNGADGLAFARLLYTGNGLAPDVFVVGDETKATDEFRVQSHILFDGLKCNKIDKVDNFDKYDLIVDAIFGIGLKRDVTGSYADVINHINNNITESAKVISVDVPSGINTDTGRVMGTAVKATYTVTFGALKTGLLLYPGTEYAGEIYVKDIGFPAEAFNQLSARHFAFDKDDLSLIPKRKSYSNKGTYGKILIVAGSSKMGGAAYMSSKAAFRAGAGLIRIYTAKENRLALNKTIPEAIIDVYENEIDIENYLSAIEWADVIVIGPGIGTGRLQESLVEHAMQAGKAIVIDADALNIIAANTELCRLYHEKCVITPHLGEMSRLTGMTIDDIKLDLPKASSDYAKKYGITCVLKDARTVISDKSGNCYYNLSGNNGMATAGSGDVLTGIIAAMISAGMDTYMAACMGAYIHGVSGDDAAQRLGVHGMMATDIIDGISVVLKECE